MVFGCTSNKSKSRRTGVEDREDVGYLPESQPSVVAGSHQSQRGVETALKEKLKELGRSWVCI